MLHGGKISGQTGYVGNTPPITRLGIPALNLNDGPQGFRSGGTTCWPSGLTVATTWDMQAMRDWGEAMGGEFFGKGANVQLVSQGFSVSASFTDAQQRDAPDPPSLRLFLTLRRACYPGSGRMRRACTALREELRVFVRRGPVFRL